MTNQTTEMCAYCGNKVGTDEHHLLRRGSNPELINEAKNKIRLCRNCHLKTEADDSFLKALQEIFYFWRPANLDIFQRAQASIDALLEGQEIEYLTPAMADHYLQLAGAAYSHYSERMAEGEKEYAPFFMARTNEHSNKAIEMEWKCTERGQEMIMAKTKTKSLEKLMANLRARMKRLETEYFNTR